MIDYFFFNYLMQLKVLLKLHFWLRLLENVVVMKKKGICYTLLMVQVVRLVYLVNCDLYPFLIIYFLKMVFVEQWGLFDKQFGRSDTQEPDPEGRVPDWTKASVQEMKDKFIAIGFGPRQVNLSLCSP